MQTMNISPSETLKEYVEQQVSAGGYSCAFLSEVALKSVKILDSEEGEIEEIAGAHY
jgi:hypothetical protein